MFPLIPLLCLSVAPASTQSTSSTQSTQPLRSATVNWPDYRGPSQDGHTAATGLPVTWSESENVRWKTAIHGRAWSSPVILGRQIWLTTATPDGKELFAVAVDKETGTILFDLKLFDVPHPQFAHSFNSYASPTPF